jgi:hypothetical protein
MLRVLRGPAELDWRRLGAMKMQHHGAIITQDGKLDRQTI